MKTGARYILFCFLMMFLSGCLSNYNALPVCRLEKDRIIFKLDKRWNKEQVIDLAGRYEIDTSLIFKAFTGSGVITVDSVTWKYRSVNPFFAELSRPLDSHSGDFLQKNEVFIIDDSWIKRPVVNEIKPVVYGINNFSRKNVFSYKNGIAQFLLPNNKNARSVYLSGTFNDWSTMQDPMNLTDSGWIVQLKLKPGKYSYKYIIDGKWGTDPDNKLEEKDDQRRYVSIIYCSNHRFELQERNDARRVVLTGNFLNWKEQGLLMEKTMSGWILDVYLRDGTYAYKYIVDGEWITDPGNNDIRKDAVGNMNSFLSIGKVFTFRLAGYKSSSRVILTGSFNNWDKVELLMQKDSSGWKLPYAIPAGNYEYKFIVDGKWITDPANPVTTGSGVYTNSFIAIDPNHTFVLENNDSASKVVVTGSFSGWNTDSYRMMKKDGKWVFPVSLKPGKYTYKFVVDGKWILDPANELWEPNEYGTNNSVLWIEQ